MACEGESREEEDSYVHFFFEIMENYSDSAIPSLSQLSRPIRNTTAIDCDDDGEKGCSSSRKRGRKKPEEAPKDGIDKVLWKEREKRGKMSEMYTELRDLVPSVFPKDPRSKIVGDTVEFIRRLEKDVKNLEDQKNLSESSIAARGGGGRGGGRISACTNWKSSVSVTISGRLVFFAIQSWVRRSLAVEILMVFEKHGVEILAANVTVVDKNQLFLSVTALVDGDGIVEEIKRGIMNL